MSDILTNAFNRRSRISFDFSKSLNENLNVISQDLIAANVPVKPKSSDWEEADGYLSSMFMFNNMSHVIYFVNQVLENGKKIRHYPLLIIDELDVTVKLQTKDLQQITELDLNYAKFISEIYDDIKFIRDF